MVFSRLKNLGKKEPSPSVGSLAPYIVILEDDQDQMPILVEYIFDEIQKIISHSSTDKRRKEIAKTIKIIKSIDIESLKSAVSIKGEIILAILDCHIPDKKDSVASDQFVKQNRLINGKHRSVDIVTQHSPGTKITMISTLNRFQKIVQNHYKKEHGLSINFINKKDPEMIKRNIGWTIKRYLNKA